MGRKQSSILDSDDGGTNNWFFVVQWITNRFRNEELVPEEYVLSEPIGMVLDRGGKQAELDEAHKRVRESWRALEKRWASGWAAEHNKKLRNADEYFAALVSDTNDWIDRNFPANGGGSGKERARLLSAVRQQRLREKRKSTRGMRNSAIQVSISGDLHKQLWKIYLPVEKQHDVVRAALQLVLNDPELVAKAKQLAGVTR